MDGSAERASDFVTVHGTALLFTILAVSFFLEWASRIYSIKHPLRTAMNFYYNNASDRCKTDVEHYIRLEIGPLTDSVNQQAIWEKLEPELEALHTACSSPKHAEWSTFIESVNAFSRGGALRLLCLIEIVPGCKYESALKDVVNTLSHRMKGSDSYVATSTVPRLVQLVSRKLNDETFTVVASGVQAYQKQT